MERPSVARRRQGVHGDGVPRGRGPPRRDRERWRVQRGHGARDLSQGAAWGQVPPRGGHHAQGHEVGELAPLSQIKVLSFLEKNEWTLETKYNIGSKKKES